MIIKRRRHHRSSSSGFTLVELLAVVAMIGILSAVAMVGYRRYLYAAKTGEAKAVILAIRIAQESFRAETMTYANCSSTLMDWYPRVNNPDGTKTPFRNRNHPDWGCWGPLNVQTDSYTTFRYAVVAGAPGTAPPAPNTTEPVTWPNPTTEPWYVIQARGNADNDNDYSTMVSSSFTGEIYVENEAE